MGGLDGRAVYQVEAVDGAHKVRRAAGATTGGRAQRENSTGFGDGEGAAYDRTRGGCTRMRVCFS
jgi:hypothetical protein